VLDDEPAEPARPMPGSVPPPLPPGAQRMIVPEQQGVQLPTPTRGPPTLVLPAVPMDPARMATPDPAPRAPSVVVADEDFQAPTLEMSAAALSVGAGTPTRQIRAVESPREEYVAPPADWGSALPSAAVPAPPPAPPAMPVGGGPPPLPHKRTRTDAQLSAVAPHQAFLLAHAAPAAPVLPAASTPAAADQDEATARVADEILKEAERARAGRLADLAEQLFRLPLSEGFTQQVERAMGRGPQQSNALTVLAAHRGMATVAVLKAFPGTLTAQLFSDEGAPQKELTDLTPLGRVILRLGDASGALVAAWGARQEPRETRYVAVLLAREVRHGSMAEVVAMRIFDDQPRVAYLAAGALERMLRGKDERHVAASGALSLLREALEGTDMGRRTAAIRAATVVHDASFVAPLIEILAQGHEDHADDAQHALVDITRQDFGSAAKKMAFLVEGQRPPAPH
jgi:hypothetical protein